MTRNFDRILTATFREGPVWPADEDADGDLRWRAGDEARKHFASLPAERREELEGTWK